MSDQNKCPLCDGGPFQKSWLGRLRFDDAFFEYRECVACASLICDPMPNAATLSKMYGSSYFEGDIDAEVSDESKFDEVAQYLTSLKPGVLVDFGCGNGELLQIASALGWTPIGVEFNPEKIAQLRSELPFEILSHAEALRSVQGDVLFLGDVIEHLTDLDKQIPEILALLKPDGVFVAIGPLEANPSLFNMALKLSRKLSRDKPVEMAPYHVLLATTNGQRALFRRKGFDETEFRTIEVAFPAAAQLTADVFKNPRQLFLFLIRKLSQAATRMSPKRLNGNRYFFAGRFVRAKD